MRGREGETDGQRNRSRCGARWYAFAKEIGARLHGVRGVPTLSAGERRADAREPDGEACGRSSAEASAHFTGPCRPGADPAEAASAKLTSHLALAGKSWSMA